MSPCCLAAATATAVLTAVVIVGLTAWVLVTDGFGLGLLLATLLAVALQRTGRIGPRAPLLYAHSTLLAVRAGWLLATSRRPLLISVLQRVFARVAGAVRRRVPASRLRGDHAHGPGCPAHQRSARERSRSGHLVE